MMFRIVAMFTVQINGWRRTTQVPTFWLSADFHGLRDEIDARRFAELMIMDMVNDDTAQISVDAVVEE